MRKKTKKRNSGHLLHWERPKQAANRNGCSGYGRSDFRERMTSFSLDFREIRSSEFVETRRKVVLCHEGNAWAPVLRSFDKLREVVVSSYLFYTLFKCFVMFELV